MPVSNGGALATNTAPGLGMAPQRLREVSRRVAEQSDHVPEADKIGRDLIDVCYE